MIEYRNIDGIQTRILMLGDGDPIIFMHGWGTSLDSFSSIFAYLKGRKKIIAADFPGFGKTSFPLDAWYLDNYVNWMIALMDSLHLTKASFVGHSFGGRVGIKLASSHPRLVNKLVLIDSAGVKQFQMNWRKKFFQKLSVLLKPLLYSLPNSWSQKIRWKFYQSIGATDYLTAGKLQETYQRVINEDLEPLLENVMIPTLLIWGNKDKSTPLSDGLLMHKKIPNSKLIVVKDAGHFPFFDNPEKVNYSIDKFLYC